MLTVKSRVHDACDDAAHNNDDRRRLVKLDTAYGIGDQARRVVN